MLHRNKILRNVLKKLQCCITMTSNFLFLSVQGSASTKEPHMLKEPTGMMAAANRAFVKTEITAITDAKIGNDIVSS